MPLMNAMYSGTVSHKRLVPLVHAFQYKIFMFHVDVDGLDDLDLPYPLFSSSRSAVIAYRRSDYFGNPQVPLGDAIRAWVGEQRGYPPSGQIYVLSHLRVFGHVFNPVTFYYCYKPDGVGIDCIVAEITNTPWKERHAYLLTLDQNLSENPGLLKFQIDKDFHVSPFFSLEYLYEMTFSIPGKNLKVGISNYQEGSRHFHASMNLAHRELSTGSLMKQVIQMPWVTIKVVWGIYWQALKLKLKGLPYIPHPGGLKSELKHKQNQKEYAA